jgi:hypothetical protein
MRAAVRRRARAFPRVSGGAAGFPAQGGARPTGGGRRVRSFRFVRGRGQARRWHTSQRALRARVVSLDELPSGIVRCAALRTADRYPRQKGVGATTRRR